METKVTFNVGDRIKIVKMDDKDGSDVEARLYNGREGTIEMIDDAGQLHGTWGGLAIVPEIDKVEKV